MRSRGESPVSEKEKRAMVSQPIHIVLLRFVNVLLLWQLLASPVGGGLSLSAFGQTRPAQPTPGSVPKQNPVPITQLVQAYTPPLVVQGALIPRPFNMITLGDSIIWGQGLPESMKFRTLVANWLQSQYGGSRKVVQWSTHAHSGAVTGWGAYPTETCPSPQNCNDPDFWYPMHPSPGYGPGYPYPGEVPFGYPSISFQIGMTVNDLKGKIDPADVDLVLFDGCINDLSANNILDVAKTEWGNGPNWVRTNTNQLCVSHAQSLLPQVMTQFPNAIVIMTGYYPIVSGNTDLIKLSEYLTVIGLAGGAGPPAAGIVGGPGAALDYLVGVPVAAVPIAAALRAALADRSQAFATTAFNGLTALVTQQNQGLTTPRVALAWPSFSDDNAYAAPNCYLFLLEDFLADEIRGSKWQAPPGDWNTPEGVAYYLAEECSIAHPSDPTCYAALVGHPNIKGAQAYAQAIISQLQGVLSARLSFPQPKTVFTRLSSGTDTNGPNVSISNYVTQVPTWIQVNAVDGSNNPVQGYVTMGPPTQLVDGYLFGVLPNGYSTVQIDQTGQRIYYMCLPHGTPITRFSGQPSNLTPLEPFPGNQQGCWVEVSASGYAGCILPLGKVSSSGTAPIQHCPAAPAIGGVVAAATNNTTAVTPNAGLTAQQLQVQLPALSASVCPTVDGKSCTSFGPLGRPIGARAMDIVTVTSGGKPVAGATVNVSGQPTVAALSNANGVAVIAHLACFAPGVVPKVGQTTVPVRVPVACPATVSKSGYEPFNTTLP
ncbi:MAG: hypothetical protein DMG38_23245 [Acidobacteria bacterium]|nr:MAG: hypothetical protein DMG38_23245 [Acidobacteriota bacterium]